MGCQPSRVFSAGGYVEIDNFAFDPSSPIYDDARRRKGALRADYIVNDTFLGHGANGDVATCSSRETGQTYALKVQTKGKKQNPQSEAFAHLQLAHPYIASLIDVYDEDEVVSLVMELCSGGELFDRLKDLGRFSEEEAARCIRQILEAVAHIHRKGFVHTDIKLENVLFASRDDKACVKLIDFGFCQPCIGEKALRSRQGTLGYMAPEVLRGYYNNKCDLFSLGVVAFSLLSGKSPVGMSNRDITNQRTLDGNYSFKKGWDGVSELAKDFVSRLLATEPEERMSAEEALQHPWLFSLPRERVWSNVPPLVEHCSSMSDGVSSEASTRAGASSVRLGRVSS
jgi:calcium-dependent protein kinase